MFPTISPHIIPTIVSLLILAGPARGQEATAEIPIRAAKPASLANGRSVQATSKWLPRTVPDYGTAASDQIAVLRPITVGVVGVLGTIFIHALVLGATVNFFRYERRRGRAGAGLRIDLTITVLVITFAFIAHLVEIALWARLLIVCGEFQQFGVAFYHSAVNYTTLGYGDIIMTRSWRMLGPLEAADGVLMFGVSTAMIFAVIVRLMQAHFEDLRSQV